MGKSHQLYAWHQIPKRSTLLEVLLQKDITNYQWKRLKDLKTSLKKYIVLTPANPWPMTTLNRAFKIALQTSYQEVRSKQEASKNHRWFAPPQAIHQIIPSGTSFPIYLKSMDPTMTSSVSTESQWNKISLIQSEISLPHPVLVGADKTWLWVSGSVWKYPALYFSWQLLILDPQQ